MARQFTIPKRTPAVIEFELVDPEGHTENYHFTAPKLAGTVLEIVGANGAMELTATREALDWLGNGLPDKQGEHILARLKDPDDPLDLDTIGDVLRWLMEQVAGRPTVRPSG